MKVVSLPKIYPPVGYCIYCGKSNVQLTDEHVIPRALGGNFLLPKSSCKVCAKQTGRVEQVCLRSMLRQFRLRHRIPHTPRNRKEQPKESSLEIVKMGQPVEFKMLPVGTHPSPLILPQYPPAGILVNRAASDNFDVKLHAFYDESELAALRTRFGADGFKLGKIHIGIFAQMLAKIGHAYVMATQTIAFKPLLSDTIIHGQTPTHFVGSELEIPPVSNVKSLFQIDQGVYVVEKRSYVIAHIRLFSFFPTPIYSVVVGELFD